MAVVKDFSIDRKQDATLTVSMSPITPIGAWEIEFRVTQHFGGGSGLIVLNTNSGFISNVSGMNISNSGQGVFTTQIRSVYTSGWDYGNYAYQFRRLNSGNETVLSEGFLMVYP